MYQDVVLNIGDYEPIYHYGVFIDMIQKSSIRSYLQYSI